ncbi:MAG: hypothetical protein AAGK22_17930 [Acidobacteriota bacterium]
MTLSHSPLRSVAALLLSRGWVLAVLLAVAWACAPPAEAPSSDEPSADAAAAPALSEDPFPALTGPHAVGLIDVSWTDVDRPDPLTSAPDDLRRVPVRFWYPAEPADGAERALYLQRPEEFAGVPAIEGAAHVRSHSVLEAPPAAGSFPVLVYHHGGGWPRFVGTSLGEELASHGWVVVSVGHDGFNQSTTRPDGSSTVPDAAPFPEPTGDLVADFEASGEFLDEVHFTQWVADAAFALDQLEELNAEGSGNPLEGRLDLARLGMFGWSFGGATSIEMLVRDERVGAAVDLDGQLFGTASETGTSKPFLLMKASEVSAGPEPEDPEEAERQAAAMVELMGRVDAQEDALIASSSGPWHLLQFEGANHGTFSDFLHLSPEAAGAVSPERAHELLTTVLRGFFGRYLLGEEAPVLEDPGAAFAELSEPRGRGEA